jgi:hypothetical protein
MTKYDKWIKEQKAKTIGDFDMIFYPEEIKQSHLDRKRRVEKTEAIQAAITGAIDKSLNGLYKKPYDIALSVRVALKEAGFKIVRQPGRSK